MSKHNTLKRIRLLERLNKELLLSRDSHKAVSSVLQSCSEYVDADFSYVYSICEEDSMIYLRWSYVNEKILPGQKLEKIRKLSIDDNNFPIEWKNKLMSGETLEYKLNDVPDNLNIKNLFKNFNIKSFFLAPIILDNKLWGFAGFSDYKTERDWHEGQKSLLINLTGSIGAVAFREEADEKTRKNKERLYAIIECSNVLLSEKNRYVSIDKVLQKSCEILNIDIGAVIREKNFECIYSCYDERKITNGDIQKITEYIHKIEATESFRKIKNYNIKVNPLLLDLDTENKHHWCGDESNKKSNIIIFPLIVFSSFWGLVVFYNKKSQKWSEFDVSYIKTISTLLSNAITRHETEEALIIYKDSLEETVYKRTNELEKIKEKALKNERLATIGKVTAIVAHELRNPIGTMSNCVSTIKRRIKKCDAQKCIGIPYKRLERSINRIESIIDELLSYTRSAPPKKTKEFFCVFINEVIDSINIPKNIEIDITCPNDLKIYIDSSRMHRAIINIIQNGVDEINNNFDGKGKITIDHKKEDSFVYIFISNTARLIEEDILEKIYEPLFSTKSFGVGLGLTIAKNTIEEHGGSITTYNSEKGVTTEIMLPME